MLKLSNVVKNYVMGNTVVEALKGVTIEFRKSEFVSVLGPSGCGKTTLLNIIGGLDSYTDGDLVINGVSTKLYKSGDWDSYRNHRIGFVFQNYNLIPHQTVLSNVELALTLSGVSKSERRRRAKEALEKVGLGDQLKKRPNQMSGGQMQRVAIARALVNDPDILLADEPTGALDSETSVQIMEILKDISKDKLIIMVTHNPELAEQYSSRIIRLLDGEVISDSAPFTSETEHTEVNVKKRKREKKPSMKLHTALSLSLNNLMTKKARTFLTSFAGSIGIIGIALILSLSNGIQAWIDSVQEDTLASYPITIYSEEMDMAALLNAFQSTVSGDVDHELDAVYSNDVMYDMFNEMINAETKTNNLKAFKEYIQKNAIASNEYISAVQFSYGFNPAVYTKDTEGAVVKSDIMELMNEVMGDNQMMGTASSNLSVGSSMGGAQVWQEMLHGEGSDPVNSLLKGQYDVIYGEWPKNANEIVLVVDENNEISDITMFSLGLKTKDEMLKIMQSAQKGEEITIQEARYTYKELCDMTFKTVFNGNCYRYDEATGTYTDLRETESGLNYLYDNGYEIKISGIIRPNPDSASHMLGGSIGYTKELTEYVIEQSNALDIVKKQLQNTQKNVINGLRFEPDTTEEISDSQKAIEFTEYVGTLTTVKKAELYTEIKCEPSQEYIQTALGQYMSMGDRATLEEMMVQSYVQSTGMDEQEIRDYISSLDDKTFNEYVTQGLTENIKQEYAAAVKQQLSQMTNEQMASLMDKEVESADEATLASYRDSFMSSAYSETDYKDTLKLLGYVDLADPTSVSFYAATFSDKDLIEDMINSYNDTVEEDDKLSYTDIAKIAMSSVTKIINAISYVLIAFVAISLVVSSIMIGIITYISVLERTKEIGILRAIGASKRDVSRVFNAETLIVGLTAGLIGIGTTILLCIPINIIVHTLSGINDINASLPPVAAVILVLISVLLTMVAGLFPAKIASKKDPVEALRTE